MTSPVIDRLLDQMNDLLVWLNHDSAEGLGPQKIFNLLDTIQDRYGVYERERKHGSISTDLTKTQFQNHIYRETMLLIDIHNSYQLIIKFISMKLPKEQKYLQQFADMIFSLNNANRDRANIIIEKIITMLINKSHSENQDNKNKMILDCILKTFEKYPILLELNTIVDDLNTDNIAHRKNLMETSKPVHPNQIRRGRNALIDDYEYKTISLYQATKNHLNGFDYDETVKVYENADKNTIKEKLNVLLKNENNKYDESTIKSLNNQEDETYFKEALPEFFTESILNNFDDNLKTDSKYALIKKIEFLTNLKNSNVPLDSKLDAAMEILLHINELMNRKYGNVEIQAAKVTALLSLANQLMSNENVQLNAKDIISNWGKKSSTFSKATAKEPLSNKELLGQHRRDFVGFRFGIIKRFLGFFDNLKTAKSKKLVKNLKRRNKS